MAFLAQIFNGLFVLGFSIPRLSLGLKKKVGCRLFLFSCTYPGQGFIFLVTRRHEQKRVRPCLIRVKKF